MIQICRFLPSVKQAWTDLVPGSVKSKTCHKEIPLLVNKPSNCILILLNSVISGIKHVN